MGRPVPGATAALRVLRYLAQRTTPVPAALVAAELGLPRSSTYHLLAAMAEESFVVHYPDDRTWGVGVAAWEVGQGYSRADPLARLARIPIARLVDGLGLSAHLAVLHGSDVFYVIEERAKGRARLVTDVGVRLPAHLTASGRAILSTLSPAQLRALFPSGRELVRRTDVGPRTFSELRPILAAARRNGHADEDSEITPGFASIAIPIASPANLASVAVTWQSPLEVDVGIVVEQLRATATVIADRLR